VHLTNVPAHIEESGATVGADVTVDPTLTVKNVEFAIGTRTVCTDDTAPYQCEILPKGDEVGAQSIRATVSDSDDQSASDSADTDVSKFATESIGINVKRSTERAGRHAAKGKARKAGKVRLVRNISGQIHFSPRVTPEQGCATGTVTLTITENGNSLFPLTQVPLSKACGYGLQFKVPKTKKHKFKVEASFGGNSVLLPISNKRRFK
jgi:hypothetical protein